MAKTGAAALAEAIAPLFIRIPLGLVFLGHGSQKLLGAFGGNGLTATFRIFEEHLGIPPLFTLLAIIAEFGGGIGVMAGFLTRISAAGIAVVMAVAIYKVHWGHGFFMNQAGQGIEFTFVLFGMAMFLVIGGGGKWCVDRLIFKG